MVQPKVVVIGAGIVGTAVADEITARGWSDVTVLDRGPLFVTGGSTSHTPGLVFRTDPSRTMTEFAKYTTAKYRALEHPDGPVFDQVGGLEVATTERRLTELRRKAGWARSWGVEGRLVDPAECARLHPLIDPAHVRGGFHTPGDGMTATLLAAEAQARSAMARGATFLPHKEVLEIIGEAGEVTGVRTTDEIIEADVVVCAAGFWSARLARLVGLTVPLVPMTHQYARTGRVPVLSDRLAAGGASLPVLRHQDDDLYFRDHGDRIGIGYSGHRPMPVDIYTVLGDSIGESMPSMMPFTASDFVPAWAGTIKLFPELADSVVEEGFNGIFSLTPDGLPIIGQHRDLAGFWVAETIWATHSAGVARAVAESIVDGAAQLDLRECDLYRFEDVELGDQFIRESSSHAFAKLGDITHPNQGRTVLRGLRRSPFHPRHKELGAYFVEGGGWERPAWFGANALLVDRLRGEGMSFPDRDPWSAEFWSPISIAEAKWTREHVALYDLTPLARYELAGSGALELLQSLTTNNIDRSVGSVAYTLLLNETGGIRSDLTVARLDTTTFRIGANSPLDFDWITRHLPADGSVVLHDITGGTCGIGVWGPAARELVQPLCDADLSNGAFGFFRVLRTHIGVFPVTMLRVSRVGELGWEIYTSAEYGGALWELLWEAGQACKVIAAGQVAMDSLRVEKGYRAWGTDLTVEHRPDDAGLGFAVHTAKDDFVGKAALASASPASTSLRSIVFDDPCAVALGNEPVFLGEACVGYVTSVGYSPTLGRTVGYAWLPADVAEGAQAAVDYHGIRYLAEVRTGPLVDVAMTRVRR